MNVLLSIFDNINAGVIVEFIFVTILLILINVFINYFIKRKFVTIPLLVFTIGFYLSYIFNLYYLSLLFITLIFILSLVAIFTNLAEFRSYIANNVNNTNRNLKDIVKKNNNKDVEKLFNRDEFYNEINKTVIYLSKNKIGAIMTFERKDNLSNFSFSKNGVKLNAPVSFELLITIFYPGTRLHDGAVVIKDNIIKLASVFYTPSTKPLNGKYGSRHRAAIGISEICDAITVVVSEETGRISIAYNGEISSYSEDSFIRAFANLMQEEDVLSLDSENKGNNLNE